MIFINFWRHKRNDNHIKKEYLQSKYIDIADYSVHSSDDQSRKDSQTNGLSMEQEDITEPQSVFEIEEEEITMEEEQLDDMR